MPLWERLLAIAGGVASIIALVDALLLKGNLSHSLSIPSQVPTGVAGVLLLMFSLLLIDANRRLSAITRFAGRLEAEKEELSARALALQNENDQLNADLTQLRDRSAKYSDLPDRVIAVLIRREAGVEEISRALGMDQRQRPALMGALAQLVREGKVEGGLLADYRVVRGR